MSVSRDQRFAKDQSCPICGGYNSQPRGQELRCHGYLSSDGQLAFCARIEEGAIKQASNGLWIHKLNGQHATAGLQPASDAKIWESPERFSEWCAGTVGLPHVKTWPYPDTGGNARMAVLRFGDTKARKEYRPMHKVPGGWAVGDPPGKLPPYGLPELKNAETIFVCEGEKACDAGKSIGLTCTTSAHGAKSADKTDWAPLRGKHVIILPDNDPDGESYAERVAELLTGVAASVRIVNLPDLPPAGDLHDFIEMSGLGDSAAIRDAIIDLAARTPEWVPRQDEECTARFPVNSLPYPVNEFVEETGRAIGCDPAFVSLPLLAGLASAIGNTRRILLKPGWVEPAIVWTVTIAPSGTLKSPAQEAALEFVRRKQNAAFEQHQEAMRAYERAKLKYERDRGQKGPGQQMCPEEPRPERMLCSDATVEALALLLAYNPRGFLLARDELSGWLGSFDAYKSARGADAAAWLEMHHAGTVIVDRKTGDRKTIHVPRAAVSITGNIQPATLERALGREHFDSGLAARLLMAKPPLTLRVWTDESVSDQTKESVEAVFEALYELGFGADEDGRPVPIDLELTPEAKAVWIKFFNEHGQEQAALSGDLSAAWSKLEGYAARFALIVHLVREATRDSALPENGQIDVMSIEAGVRLSRWFCGEARRVYALLSESEEERDIRELVELVRAKGGRISVRELMRSKARYAHSADCAREALGKLVAMRLGHWEPPNPSQAGGRPSEVFVLNDNDKTDKTPLDEGGLQ